MSAPTLPAWVPRQLGRRGAILLLIGIVWILMGVGLLFDPKPAFPPSYLVLHERLPVVLRVGLWWTAGGVAVLHAWRRTPGADTAGFVALMLMSVERSASFFFSWVVSILSTLGWADPQGYTAGWTGGLAWAAVTALILVCAGWPEPGGHAPPYDVGEGESEGDT